MSAKTSEGGSKVIRTIPLPPTVGTKASLSQGASSLGTAAQGSRGHSRGGGDGDVETPSRGALPPHHSQACPGALLRLTPGVVWMLGFPEFHQLLLWIRGNAPNLSSLSVLYLVSRAAPIWHLLSLSPGLKGDDRSSESLLRAGKQPSAQAVRTCPSVSPGPRGASALACLNLGCPPVMEIAVSNGLAATRGFPEEKAGRSHGEGGVACAPLAVQPLHRCLCSGREPAGWGGGAAQRGGERRASFEHCGVRGRGLSPGLS